ncbi:MAG: LacI family DNA-binding transcriptional regulator [Candidatus Microbacterium stercoravium]
MDTPRAKPTSRDVAQLAGVSPATVSRIFRDVFNGPEAVRASVLQAATQLDYQPNTYARQMRTGRSHRIRLVVGDIVAPGVAELIAASVDEAAARGLSIVLSSVDQAGASLEADGRPPRGQEDGLVWIDPRPEHQTVLQSFTGSIPVVAIGGDPDGQFDSVRSDGSQAGRAVARYFADNGRLRVALVGDLSRGEDAAGGFRRGVRAFELHLDSLAVLDCADSESASADAVARLAARTMPDAIFALSPRAALGAIDGLHRLGLVVPKHVWVCGFGDAHAATLEPYRLTVSRTAPTEIAGAALDAITTRIADTDSAPRQSTLPAELLIRASTGDVPQNPGGS